MPTQLGKPQSILVYLGKQGDVSYSSLSYIIGNKGTWLSTIQAPGLQSPSKEYASWNISWSTFLFWFLIQTNCEKKNYFY